MEYLVRLFVQEVVFFMYPHRSGYLDISMILDRWNITVENSGSKNNLLAL